MTEDETSLREKAYQATAASPGQATGPTQIIEIDQRNDGQYPKRTNITGLEKIDSGDILVTPDVYPSMIEEIKQSSGLIIYTEQRLTGRGSVVARDLGLPAVIDCPELITEIQSGDQVTVDGDQGQIF